MPRRLSQIQRMKIVFLKQARLKNAKIIAEMARNRGPNVDRRTIQRVWAKYKQTHSVADRKGRGRKRSWQRAEETALRRLALQNRWVTLKELTQLANTKRIVGRRMLSESVVRRTLKKFGLGRRVALPKPLLSADQRAIFIYYIIIYENSI